MIFLFPRWDMLIPWRVIGTPLKVQVGVFFFSEFGDLEKKTPLCGPVGCRHPRMGWTSFFSESGTRRGFWSERFLELRYPVGLFEAHCRSGIIIYRYIYIYIAYSTLIFVAPIFCWVSILQMFVRFYQLESSGSSAKVQKCFTSCALVGKR